MILNFGELCEYRMSVPPVIFLLQNKELLFKPRAEPTFLPRGEVIDSV